MHRDPEYYPIRNHLVDFLLNRSKLYSGGEQGAASTPGTSQRAAAKIVHFRH
jgi:nitrate/nitrite transport system ATP-binding protein